MDKVRRLSDSICDTPSPESYRVVRFSVWVLNCGLFVPRQVPTHACAMLVECCHQCCSECLSRNAATFFCNECTWNVATFICSDCTVS